MSRDKRKSIIQKIQTKRGSKVIAYVTNDRHNLASRIASDVVPIIHEHLLAMNLEGKAKLDLFIYSRGGDSDVPWTLVSMFREYSKEGAFSVLIPYRAHSAATVISLGADEIVMTKKAELGPIDITIEKGPYNPTEQNSPQRLPISVEDVTGYFSLLEKVGCERPEEKLKGFQQLTDKVHPLALGNVSRLLEQTKLVALRLLGTRSNPFPEEKNREIVKKLSSEIFSHRHTISRTEATQQLGLNQVIEAEKSGIENELWDLYNEYKGLFSFEDPFLPEEHLIVKNLQEHEWVGLPIACVESEIRYDVYKTDLKLKKLRQVPPQLTLNLGNISFPALNLSNLPAEVTANQIAQTIQQLMPSLIQPIINQAAENAIEKLLNSLPTVGFERIDYNKGWKQEC